MAKKRVHFIRHAQSQHNARAALVADETSVRLDPTMRDAGLTDLGHAQARAIAPGICKLTGIEVVVVTPLTRAIAPGICKLTGIEVVVVTPLTRAIQTMRHAFADHPALRVVLDLHREHQWSFCDIGLPPAALAEAYPDLSFDHLRDPWWHVDPDHPGPFAIETEAMLDDRIEAFRDWLADRPEREIAVVGHGTFLNRLTGHWYDNTTRVSVDF